VNSNITIASNIYIRAHDDIQRDISYAHHITGKKKLTEIKNRYCAGSMSSFKLTQWQEKILKNELSCLYARNGEITHGLVKVGDELRWVGRCEYAECHRYDFCSEVLKCTREKVDFVEVDQRRETDSLVYEWLGIDDVEAIFTSFDSDDDIAIEDVPPEAVIENIKEFARSDEYIKISAPDEIINASVESKILVNAAPGSGKTYTVIKRLEHIISNYSVGDFASVLVLVYTNAAKNEILSRLESGVQVGVLPHSARNIDVCTFDSLATSYLSTIEANFMGLDYNGRIRLFNEKFDKENFSNFEYVIIDELQDLVNERAIMTLNIISALQSGYLLLGDKCQAIYDYDCNDGHSIDSVEFYKRLDALLPNNALKYELTGNHRQVSSSTLSRLSSDMRSALLDFEPADANGLIIDEINSISVIGRVEKMDLSDTTRKTAILCRSNGEAEYVSHLLHKKHISHHLLRSVGYIPSLNRWIADCLWDYKVSSRITKAVFISRYCNRVENDEDKASSCFDALCDFAYGDEKDFVEIEKLTNKLARPVGKIPELLLNTHDANITVSTIHKAKGREFDVVYLLDSTFIPDNSNTEEARVWYVGCTRAKKELGKVERNRLFFKRSSTNDKRCKWVAPAGWYRHCKRVVVGLPSDILPAGFVAGELFHALDTQAYIANSVAVGNELKLVLVDGHYHVYHNGNAVGCLDASAYFDLLGIAKESIRNSGAPPYLSPVYVTNIVTIPYASVHDEISPYYRDSIWLGIEISGFPEIDWNYSRA